MPTLISAKTFEQLQKIRGQAIVELAARSPDAGKTAGIFVPWAGKRLIDEGGIYYVGMGTHGEYNTDKPQTLDSCLELARALCHENIQSDFWQFLDGLSWTLFNASFDETIDQWGWSNLLKVGWSKGNPTNWPRALMMRQTEACIAALYEELMALRNSLVIVATYNTFAILDAVLPKVIPSWDTSSWQRDHEEAAGLWWLKDPKSNNLYVHCYHPRAAVIYKFWGTMLGCTVKLARCALPNFSR
jgi:hypothetical protein